MGAAWREADRVDRQRYEAQHCAGHSVPAPGAEDGSGADGLYALLGVERSASQAQLRRAWLRLLVRSHPDKGGCPVRFAALQAAYATLSDPAARLAHDEQLARRDSGQACSTSAAAHMGAEGQQVARQQAGVRVVVHGHTRPSRAPPRPSTAAEAGRQQAPDSPHGGGGDPVAEVTALLQQLLAGHGCTGGDGSPTHPAQTQERHRKEQLARLYLQRALLQQERGRLHHAMFDCEEALAAEPGCTEAARVAAELRRAGAVLPAEEATAAQHAESCNSSSDDEGS
eukprot:scaffold21.g2197.t1